MDPQWVEGPVPRCTGEMRGLESTGCACGDAFCCALLHAGHHRGTGHLGAIGQW